MYVCTSLFKQSDWYEKLQLRACVCVCGSTSYFAHIFRSNGAMGLKIGMYSNPPMGGRQPNFQKKISAQKKVFVLLPPQTSKSRISSCNGPHGLKICRNTQPYVGNKPPKVGNEKKYI